MPTPRLISPLLLLSAWLLCALSAAAQAVELRIDRPEILIGQQARLTLSVTAPERARVELPAYAAGDTLTRGLEVVATLPVDTTRLAGEGRVRYERPYLITSFDSALYRIPALVALVDGKPLAARARLGLKVGSVPVDTVHVDQFAPPFAPLDMPFAWRYATWGKAQVLWLLAALIITLSVWLRRGKPITRRRHIQPPVPPCCEALGVLQALGAEVENEAGEKAFYIALSDAVRRYLARRYAFGASEMTTGEIADALTAHLATPTSAPLLEVLRTADGVKFAREHAGQFAREHALKVATAFATDTRDEGQEHPAVIVEVLTLSARKQRAARVAAWAALLLGCAALTACSAWLWGEELTLYF